MAHRPALDRMTRSGCRPGRRIRSAKDGPVRRSSQRARAVARRPPRFFDGATPINLQFDLRQPVRLTPQLSCERTPIYARHWWPRNTQRQAPISQPRRRSSASTYVRRKARQCSGGVERPWRADSGAPCGEQTQRVPRDLEPAGAPTSARLPGAPASPTRSRGGSPGRIERSTAHPPPISSSICSSLSA